MLDQADIDMQIRKLLKQFGVTSQQQLEQALAQAPGLESGSRLPVRMRLEVDGLELSHTVSGELRLE